MKVTVVGGGAWGTALADLLARKGEQVTLWARESEVIESVNQRHRNDMFLPGAELAPGLRAEADLAASLRGVDTIVSVAPSHAVRDVMTQAAAALRDARPLVVSASKGLDPDRLERPSHVLGEVLATATPIAVLSGPSFAWEVFQRQPTAVVAASTVDDVARRTQRLFSTNYFRVYSHTDVIGVELAGALKNVIALAAGILEGLGMGFNTRAAMITRGLAEITRIGVALGAHAQTFAGLSGMGDLVLTCSGDASRNRRVGLALGRGRSMPEILGEMTQVAEGVKTTKVAKQLAEQLGVEVPITEAMYAIMHAGVPVREAIHALLTRPTRSERD